MTALKLTQIGNSVGVILPKKELKMSRLTAQQPDAIVTTFAVVSGDLNEEALADWMRRNLSKR